MILRVKGDKISIFKVRGKKTDYDNSSRRQNIFFLCFKRGSILILSNFSILLCCKEGLRAHLPPETGGSVPKALASSPVETMPEGPTIAKTSISVLLVIIHFHRPMPNPSIPYHFITRTVSHLFSITKHIYRYTQPSYEKELSPMYYAATHFWYHYLYTLHNSKHPIT